MWKPALLFSLLFACSEGITEGPDIVDGTLVVGNDRPYQVSLQEFGIHVCGGSILNKNWIITAAHCTIGFNDTTLFLLTAAVGMLDVKHPGQSHQIAKKLEHEKYDPKDSYRNDIALAKIVDEFTFNSMVQPTKLPRAHLVVPDNSSVVLSGWGELGGNDTRKPDDLREVTIYTVELKRCRKLDARPGTHVYKTNICAYNPKKRAGQCTYDSGGPLTWDGTQVGIVSYSFKDPYCAMTTRPGLYTNVAEYIDWIKDNSAD